MNSLVAIVGRPNVGKSSLFNRLIGHRHAIVLDTPGVTRDRNYGEARWGGRTFSVVDTGGFEPTAVEGVIAQMREQAMLAIESADVVLLIVDAREGLVEADREVVQLLRRAHEKVVYAVNKVDGEKQEELVTDFYELGVDRLHAVSAEHGRGVGRLLDHIVTLLPGCEDDDLVDKPGHEVTRFAIIGRPNVGKSTLSNRLLGEERMIVHEVPGTTRDAIDANFTWQGAPYTLIDTAGLRRKRGISRGTSESFSVLRTLKALDRCDVAVLVLDATEGPTDQDARVLGLAADKGRGLVLVINKWDAVDKDPKSAQRFTDDVRLKLPFANYAPVLYISGKTGQRVNRLMPLVAQVRAAHQSRVGTGELNRWLEVCTQKHQPPVVKNRRLKLYYATQARTAPPTIVISCNDPESVHFSYERFLLNQFRESFPVEGTPVRLFFRGKKDRHDEE